MAKQNFDDFLPIPGILWTVWQTTGDSLTISWQHTRQKLQAYAAAWSKKGHKYILYRHLLLSSRAKSTRRSKTSSPPANRRGSRRRRAAVASRSFLLVPDFRFIPKITAKKHKDILYRHLLLSSRAKSTRRSKTSSPPANRRGTAAQPGRRAAASRSFLFVPDFRFVRALNELNLKWNSLPTSTSKRLTRKLAYLGQQRRKLSVVRDAKLGPHRWCSLWSECPHFVRKWWGPFLPFK